MAKAVATTRLVKDVFQAIPHLRRLASNQLWVDYDGEADVLYISFEKPQHATDSVLQDDNVLLRYRGKKLVGITIIGTKTARLSA